MKTALQALTGQRKVSVHGRGDCHGLHAKFQQLLESSHGLDVIESAFRRRPTHGAHVEHRYGLGGRTGREIPNEVRTPISVTDDADRNSIHKQYWPYRAR